MSNALLVVPDIHARPVTSGFNRCLGRLARIQPAQGWSMGVQGERESSTLFDGGCKGESRSLTLPQGVPRGEGALAPWSWGCRGSRNAPLTCLREAASARQAGDAMATRCAGSGAARPVMGTRQRGSTKAPHSSWGEAEPGGRESPAHSAGGIQQGAARTPLARWCCATRALWRV
jgi:hypothetical protein